MSKNNSNPMNRRLEDSGNEIVDTVRFEALGINLIISPSFTQFECKTCGERWRANLGRTRDEYWMQLILSTMEETFKAPYLCPNGCNKKI